MCLQNYIKFSNLQIYINEFKMGNVSPFMGIIRKNIDYLWVVCFHFIFIIFARLKN
jgi:hypothetical protein